MIRHILLRLRLISPTWRDLSLHERLLACAIRGEVMMRRDWGFALRGLVVLLPIGALAYLQLFGRWLDGAAGRRFDVLMDWAHGDKSWRDS